VERGEGVRGGLVANSIDMDDAGNGLRGLRATPSPQLFELLRERYGLDRTAEARDLGGSSNLNLLIAAGGSRCVARVYRPHVSPSRLDAIQRVRRELARGGVPCASMAPSREGEPWTMIDGRLVEVEGFVEHDGDMDSWERLELGLPWLGRLHSLLRAVNVGPEGKTPLFANHVEPFAALDWTLRGTQRIRSWGASAGELRLAEAAEALAQRVADAERDVVSSVPRQLVHGDFWDNNVCFREGRVVLVTDFDFMGERARIDDLALTLYFTNSTFSEDPVSDDRIHRLRRLVDAYDQGLEDPLTRMERAALPLAIARQPLWAVGRWLALLDDEERARRLAAELSWDVEWALQIMRDIGRWQAAFAQGAENSP
jgi:Ser/Thr protein kinase RdoA (MazF antagonist)